MIKNKTTGIVKAVIVALTLILQVALLFVLVMLFREKVTWAYIAIEVLSVITIFALVNDTTSYNYFWIIIVLALPVVGFCLYGMWGHRRKNSRTNRRFHEVTQKGRTYKAQDPQVLDEMIRQHKDRAQISKYLISEDFPLYKNTAVRYFEVGEKKFDALFEDMEKAEKFIFLEYFIVSQGQIWERTKEILARKAAEKLEVRLLVDDFGCLIIDTETIRHEMAQIGVRVSVFAPITKDVSRLTFNYRNHQKIAIIDGNIGYTGGINLADEYANIYERFGHWKDTAVRLEGDGVWGLTEIFLEMWEFSRENEDMDYDRYRPTVSVEAEGFVQPMADGPANNPDNPIEETYIHLINKAKDYIYFTTPYLVLDNTTVDALCRAARSGVDVRVITPRIYDKWYVYMVTVFNYGKLLQNGIRIYEYVPGFIHAKNVVSDDECAVCGSINMDYRSFYLHYECGVLMTDVPAVMDIKQDFLDTQSVSERISYDTWKKRPFPQKVIQWVLRIFSPML